MVERLLVHVLQQHRDAGIRVGHRNAAAHGPRTDDRGVLDGLRRRVSRHVRDLGRLPFCEEQMPQRLGFRGHETLGEEFAFAQRAFVECVFYAVLDGLERGVRSARAFRCFREGGSRGLCRVVCPRSIQDPVRKLARLAPLAAGGARGREEDRCGTQLAGRNLVDETGGESLLCGDRLAVRAHADGELGTYQARQTLRARGSRDQTNQDLRLPDVCVGADDAVVASHRDFVTATERVAANRGDQGLRTVLQATQDRVRTFRSPHRVGGGSHGVEKSDIAAGDERRSRADQHYPVDGVIECGARDVAIDRVP